MSLQVRRTSGNDFTDEDRLETRLTYSGNLHTCVHTINVVSGPDCTHGGGAAAGEYLHYHNHGVDADSDGFIDYSTSNMFVVQETKGDSVIEVWAKVVFQADVDQFLAEHSAWSDAYETVYLDNKGSVAYVEIAEGAPDRPVQAAPTIYKSGQITLKYGDDSFV